MSNLRRQLTPEQQQQYEDDKAFEIKFRVQVDGKIKSEGATNVDDVVFEMFRGTPESGYLFVVKGHFRAPGPKIHLPN